jgi:ATP phosphoribosyltransferase
MTVLTIALSKGRIFEETRPLLLQAGILLRDEDVQSRQLRFASACGQFNLLVLRATDVPVFVAHGAADLGVVGKDVLMEHGGEGLYEPLDLHVAKCRLMVAEAIVPVVREGAQAFVQIKRVATKYEQVARRYFAELGQPVEVIKLYGSMELAPIVGLADVIVDVVDTGKTLQANGLKATDCIAQISSRLIVNKASMKLKHKILQSLITRLADAVAAKRAGQEGRV